VTGAGGMNLEPEKRPVYSLRPTRPFNVADTGSASASYSYGGGAGDNNYNPSSDSRTYDHHDQKKKNQAESRYCPLVGGNLQLRRARRTEVRRGDGVKGESLPR
jgi:hypothetical protein